jgi:hypothetical protein
MGFTVVHENGMQGRPYRDYLLLLSRLLVKRGVPLERVPLTGGANGLPPLYVWDSEADAAAFAAQLREFSEDPAWKVVALTGQTRLGSLRPLEIEAGKQVLAWNFALGIFTRLSLQKRYPGSCQRSGVSVRWDYPPGAPASAAELQALTPLVLPLLTGLGIEDLLPFGSYVVVDPVANRVLVGPIPFQRAGSSGGAEASTPADFPVADRSTGSSPQALR